MIETARQPKSQLLTDDWRINPVQFGVPANSQVSATLVRDAGFEGILYQCVRGPRHCIGAQHPPSPRIAGDGARLCAA